MPRLKIQLPATLLLTVSVPVRITDINYGNHLGNSALVDIIHEARMRFLRTHSFSELDICGTSLIMSELLVEYKSEAFYGDVLDIELYCGDVSRVHFELYYNITTHRNGRKLIIATARTGLVCFDYSNKKVSPVPELLKSVLGTAVKDKPGES